MFVPQPVDPEAERRRNEARKWSAWMDACASVLEAARATIARLPYRWGTCESRFCGRQAYVRRERVWGRVAAVCGKCYDRAERRRIEGMA